jgi:hypothetical protein
MVPGRNRPAAGEIRAPLHRVPDVLNKEADMVDGDPPLPPYDELRGEPGVNTAPTAYDADNAPEPGPEPIRSDEERGGLSSTDTAPEPALGVGRSHGARGEELAPDRDDATKGPSGRPVGRAGEGEPDSVGAQENVDPRSPRLQAGDQGG